MYGVVVCSRCRRAKGVRVGQKTTLCQCGRTIDLASTKIKSKASDAREAARLVGLENARLRGGKEEYERASRPPPRGKGAHGRVAVTAENVRGRDQRIKSVAAGLSKELGTFTARDFTVVLVSLGIPDPQTRLEELVAINFIYQPTPGRFRAV